MNVIGISQAEQQNILRLLAAVSCFPSLFSVVLNSYSLLILILILVIIIIYYLLSYLPYHLGNVVGESGLPTARREGLHCRQDCTIFRCKIITTSRSNDTNVLVSFSLSFFHSIYPSNLFPLLLIDHSFIPSSSFFFYFFISRITELWKYVVWKQNMAREEERPTKSPSITYKPARTGMDWPKLSTADCLIGWLPD